MTDNFLSPSFPAATLTRQSVLNAVNALCGINRSAATLLRLVLKRLTAQTGNWAAQVRRLNFLKIAAHYGAAPLREILLLPGDLALLQRSEGSFTLLHLHEQRWRCIGTDGLPLSDVVDVNSDVYVEAVVLQMPLIHWKPQGLASLAAIWPELRAAWAEVGLASLFINAGQLLLPLFAMLVYDKVANNGLFETLWTLTMGMALYVATDMGMRFVRSWATERVGVELTLRSDEGLWHKLLAQRELPPGGFARFLSNYRDLSLSRDFVSSSYLLALADIPFLLLYLLVIGIIAWPLLLVAVLLVLIYTGVGLILQARVNSLTQKAEQENTRKLMFMGDVLGALDVACTTPGAAFFLRHWRVLAGKSARSDAGRRLAASHQGMLSIAMQTVSTVIILVVGVYLIDARLLSIGKLIACNLLTSRAMGLVASLFAVTGKWQDFKRAAARMEGSLKMADERVRTPRPDTSGHITVIGLNKKYEGRPPALENVSFTVKPGERLALLGRPGAGKTTLLRALAGLCATDGGQILIDGLALEDIAASDRMRWLAYKSQEPVVFAGTLENNLGVAGCHDSKRFAQALWVTGLDNEFTSGRMSLGMELEERGSNLSGGQRQKVALARALAQPSRLLLLDEPTLGLDPDSERMLAERLPSFLAPDSVLLMTTHSAIMLNIVQRIIALDGGRVVADGDREKLVRIG
jgi:ABC-type bacteriocin/lantibiotic exporter with double-glycine peptidase domain